MISIVDLLIHGITFTDIMFKSVRASYRTAVKQIEYMCDQSTTLSLVYAGSIEDGMYLPYYFRTSGTSGIWNVSTDIDLLLFNETIKITADIPTGSRMEGDNCYWVCPSKYPGYCYLIPSDYANDEVKSDPELISKYALSCNTATEEIRNHVKSYDKYSGFLFLSIPQRHGPSISFSSHEGSGGVLQSVDCVACIHCPFWPDFSKLFFERQRVHDFPRKGVISDIYTNGCQFVPVGYHGSALYDFEWRLSSVLAEKRIIQEMTLKQKLAYRLTKALLKTNWQTKDIIKSYHLKTILFWLCEERPMDDWDKSSHVKNIELLLDNLLKAYSKMSLPNYFIVENNMITCLSESSIKAACVGIESVSKSLIGNLYKLLLSTKILPASSSLQLQLQQTELTYITIDKVNQDNLFFFSANMCLCSFTYHLLGDVDEFHLGNDKDKSFFDLSVQILNCQKHQLSPQTQGFPERFPSVEEEFDLSHLFELFKIVLDYADSRYPSSTVSDLCLSLLNVSCTVLSGYFEVTKTTRSSIDKCFRCLDFSAQMHHKKASGFISNIFQQFPGYNIEQPPKDATDKKQNTFYWLELFVIVLIKYQRQKCYEFGKIGDGKFDAMFVPMSIRKLIQILIYYDYDKTWILLQIERSLFASKNISSFLQLLQPLLHGDVKTEIDGNINFVRLMARISKDKRNTFNQMWQLGNLYHSRGLQENSKDCRNIYFKKSLEKFSSLEIDQISYLPSWKIDFALLSLAMGNTEKVVSLLLDVTGDVKVKHSKLLYNRATITIVSALKHIERDKEYMATDIIAELILFVYDSNRVTVNLISELCLRCLRLYEDINGMTSIGQNLKCKLIDLKKTVGIEIIYTRE